MEVRNITVELNCNTVDDIIKQELISIQDNLIDDLRKREKGKGTAIFETDKTLDVALIKEHIEAFDLVLKYYGVGKK